MAVVINEAIVDYCPFGLTFNSYQRENSLDQKYLYNGKEKQDELGLDWLDYGMRMYDPSIARWMVVDPLTHKLPNWTPYRYAFNNPLAFTDLRGAIEWPVKGNSAVNKRDYSDGAWSLQNTVVRTSTYNEIRNIGTSPHVGIDYRAAAGTQFYSLGDGKVVDIGTQGSGGAKGAKYITVEYANGDKVSFVHISSTTDGLKVGDQVYEGQVLGLTGETGATGRPHLHLTARNKDGDRIDPENKNYGSVSNEDFFGKYGGDYTKLPGYVNAHSESGEGEEASADVKTKKDKVEVKNGNASFWQEFMNQAQQGINNLDNWLRNFR